MAEYLLRDEDLQDLRGKVIIVTGGATGIGRALVQLAHDHGAKVAACDVNIEAGKELEQQLPTDFLFKKCDVSIWKDVIEFFQETYQRFGTIDTVFSNAAINKVESLDDLDATDITDGEELQEPDLSVLKVNMFGTWYVTRCAIHFFLASYFDTPPLYTYCASKAGVLGLFRALRTQTVKYNISVNMIAPWMTLTDMVTDHVKKVWGDLPANTPLDVAKASLLCVVRPEINGKAFLINGGRFTEVEDKLDETQAVWLGSELDKNMREGQRRLID
ncbi:3-hydroxyacyl-CoA dehydrogenase [Fusarium sp. NRRL 25303]|nr:3-hydroxyacyl-CoA dehydrogenase [Fusarium sp. NRRL 25303]